MATYLLLYRSTTSPTEQLADASPEQAEAGMQQWMTWAGQAGEAIVDLGSPLNQVGRFPGGSSDVGGGYIGGFSIMEADSVDALEKLLDGHPHLVMDDAAIDILEFLPIPGM